MPTQDANTIGSATMKTDGTIVLFLRAEGPGGMIGDAMRVYEPKHPRYDGILAHVGPLDPGQSVLVRAWPEPEPQEAAGAATAGRKKWWKFW